MKSVVRPELPTAAAGPSQAPAAAVDNSAPRSTHPESTYKSGKAVQTTGTTSVLPCPDSQVSPDVTFDQVLRNPLTARLAGNIIRTIRWLRLPNPFYRLPESRSLVH